MEKKLQFISVTRNLNFVGLKKQDKEFLYENYPIIIRKPKGTFDDEDYETFCEHCLNMSLKDRQIVYHGILFDLSKKEYLMVCSLLLFGEIRESEFNKIDFRPKRCNKANKKAPRNLEKSIDDLRSAFWNKISKKNSEASKPILDKDDFKKHFKNEFVQYKIGDESTAITKYRKAVLPDFLKKVCKQN